MTNGMIMATVMTTTTAAAMPTSNFLTPHLPGLHAGIGRAPQPAGLIFIPDLLLAAVKRPSVGAVGASRAAAILLRTRLRRIAIVGRIQLRSAGGVSRVGAAGDRP